jgi:predicted enzyme related to lactoylglutathione lyase
MAEFSSYPSGTPSWVDLSTSDPDAASAFYAGLFGWQVQDLGPEAGGYRMCLKNGKQVAGIGPMMSEAQFPAWSTYVSVDDAKATVDKASSAGAKVIAEPMDVMGQGTMAVLVDPTGAYFSLWQPGMHTGAQLANEAGAFTWNELQTRDTAAAESFYRAVFGWQAQHRDMGGGTTYTEFQLDGHSVAGMMAMPPEVPAEVPSYWLVYFSVEDTDARVAAATQAAGRVLFGPHDSPQGPFAVLADPQGAVFAVIAPRS